MVKDFNYSYLLIGIVLVTVVVFAFYNFDPTTGKAVGVSGDQIDGVKGSVGTVEILTTPIGASLNIDGVSMGNSPYVYKGLAGSHRLKITKEGYQISLVYFDLVDGRKLTQNFVLQVLPASCNRVGNYYRCRNPPYTTAASCGVLGVREYTNQRYTDVSFNCCVAGSNEWDCYINGNRPLSAGTNSTNSSSTNSSS